MPARNATRLKMARKLLWIAPIVVVLPLAGFGGSLWWASGQLLFPAWRGVSNDLAVCGPEAAEHWGEGCGNLRLTRAFDFREVHVPSVNGYELPGWLIHTADNGSEEPARGAVMLIHGGGSDRRDQSRYIPLFLDRGLDVLTLDLACHGEAPCPVPGMTYGHRESRDVLSAYLYLAERYDDVLAMGSSVGAASILIALPWMPGVRAVIAENPMSSFQRLIVESPEAQSAPGWFIDRLIRLAMTRGRFDGLLSPENALPLAGATPILFIHSRRDEVVSHRQTQDLADAYAGPTEVWLPDRGGHAAIWNADPAEYERRVTAFLDEAEHAWIVSPSEPRPADS
jgi:uncharacterized protein